MFRYDLNIVIFHRHVRLVKPIKLKAKKKPQWRYRKDNLNTPNMEHKIKLKLYNDLHILNFELIKHFLYI